MASQDRYSIISLPDEVLVSIFMRLASSSALDVFSAQEVCRQFHAAGSHPLVLRAIRLHQVFPRPRHLPYPNRWEFPYQQFINRCMVAGNPEATFRVAFARLFIGVEIGSSFQTISTLAAEGYTLARYVVGLLEVCTVSREKEGREMLGSLVQGAQGMAHHRRLIITALRKTVCTLLRLIRPQTFPFNVLFPNMYIPRPACRKCPGFAMIEVQFLYAVALEGYEESFNILCENCYWVREAFHFTNRINTGSWLLTL